MSGDPPALDLDPGAASRTDTGRLLGELIHPAIAGLAGELAAVPELVQAERQAVLAGVTAALQETSWRLVHRVVLVELHAARISGQLTAADPAARWQEWIDLLARPGGWQRLAEPYPDLLTRLRTVIANRCAAGYRLSVRFGADRDALTGLLGTEPGALAAVQFGAGDSHQAGQSVCLLRLAGGRLVYKPRPVTVDAALAQLLPRLLPDEPDRTRIRVPPVVARQDRAGEYGWAGYVAHQYCRNDSELRTFYRGLGHWLAVMRLLSGSDLHAENLIAAGPVPVVVDCETLFTPPQPPAPDAGAAVALATELLGRSVLHTGLLPGRAGRAGQRGADISAAGSLPDQQPARQRATIIDPGTDRARLGSAEAPPPPPARNHPSPQPDLGRYWDYVVAGYSELTDRLIELDRAGALAAELAPFRDRRVRVVLRDTATYAELLRMLWHPSALYEPELAWQRATDVLARHGARRTGAPDDPAVIAAEVAELRVADVPVFTTTPQDGVLAGPGGTTWGEPQDLVAATLQRWRASDPETDRQVIRASLVSAYLNDGWQPSPPQPATRPVRADDPDRHRREQAASIMRQLARSAIRGDDGTVTWLAPTLDPTGWAVRPITTDLYNGLAGVAVLLAAYQREVAAGRADPVPDLDGLAAAVIRSLRLAEDQQAAERAAADAAGAPARPEPPGGYLGLGSRIWAWLLLHRLGALSADEARHRAEAVAGQLPEAIAADQTHDLLSGAAGAVVPLLRLAEYGGDRWRELAQAIGQRLHDQAFRTGEGAYWESLPGMAPAIGLSHGVFGIGWALHRLAAATGDPGPERLAAAGFGWCESYFDRQQRGWRDPRAPAQTTPRSWCHGAPGIGVAAADLLTAGGGGPATTAGAGGPAGDRPGWREVLARAAHDTWPDGFERRFILCHGDLGCWEVLDRAWLAGVGPPGVDREAVTAQLLADLAQYGPATGVTRDIFQPGMMIGNGGIAYQLLRMHPACDLPSVLLPDPGLNERGWRSQEAVKP